MFFLFQMLTYERIMKNKRISNIQQFIQKDFRDRMSKIY